MSAIGRIADVFDRGPLSRADRPRWAAARTLPDLCELTAQWLEGRIKSQPGYYGPVDVDEDDAPGLTDTLITLNRVGFLTSSSQAGFDGADSNGAHWQQRAAVTGFTTEKVLNRIYDVLPTPPYYVLVYPCGRNLRRRGRGIPVTTCEGRNYTTFGSQVGPFIIASELYDGCSDEAIDAVCHALQVTIYDPRVGRNDLWSQLRTKKEANAR